MDKPTICMSASHLYRHQESAMLFIKAYQSLLGIGAKNYDL